MLEVLVFGFGLVIWHWAGREKSKVLYFGGGVLVLAAILGTLCSFYYYLSYRSEGVFNNAHPMQMTPGMKGNMLDRGGVMSPGMNMPMHGKMMENMNTCMAQMQGQAMDQAKMKQMRECMMGQMGQETPSQKPE